MLKKIAYIVAAIVVLILGMAALQPSTFSVKRSITIKAPAEKIVPLVSDFHQWALWSPWEKLDPAMVRTFSGAASGKGAVYGWNGNSEVGEGRMEILDVKGNASVDIKLDFMRPMEGHNDCLFTFDSKGDSTTVNWTMSGPVPFMSKIMTVFVTLDRMIGPDFEKGLSQLKAVAEK